MSHYSEFENRPELVRKRGQFIFARNAFYILLGFIVAISLGIQTYNAVQGTRARNELLDCTTPEGQCYKESQKRTGEVVGQIVAQTLEGTGAQSLDTQKVVVEAAYCAASVDEVTEPLMKACLDERLEK